MGNPILIEHVKEKFIALQLGYFIERDADDFFPQAVVVADLKMAATELRVPVYTV